MIRDDQLLISGDPEHSQALARVFEQHYAKPEPEQKSAPAPAQKMRQMPYGRPVTEAQYQAWRRRGGRWPGE